MTHSSIQEPGCESTLPCRGELGRREANEQGEFETRLEGLSLDPSDEARSLRLIRLLPHADDKSGGMS